MKSNCITIFQNTYHRDPDGVSFCPYRVCPLGAHVDHQHGQVNGLAINYGIHIVEALGGILGNGAESVRFIGKALVDSSYSESWRVSYANGRNGIYTILTGVHQPFSITVMTTKKVYQFTMDSMRLYDALIEQVANFMEGKNTLISDFGYVLESVKIMLAGTKSRSLNGKEIFLSELKENDPSFDGEKFWKKYGAASGPMYAI